SRYVGDAMGADIPFVGRRHDRRLGSGDLDHRPSRADGDQPEPVLRKQHGRRGSKYCDYSANLRKRLGIHQWTDQWTDRAEQQSGLLALASLQLRSLL